jgi:hypothetical protein
MIDYMTYQKEFSEELKRHRKKLLKLESELKVFQSKCKHDGSKTFYSDPSGNNAGIFECDICKAEI